MSWLFKEFPVPPAKAGSLMPSPRGDYFALSPRRSGDLGAPGAMGASDRAGVPVGRSAADPGDRLGLSQGRPQAHGSRARLPSQERRYFGGFQGVSVAPAKAGAQMPSPRGSSFALKRSILGAAVP